MSLYAQCFPEYIKQCLLSMLSGVIVCQQGDNYLCIGVPYSLRYWSYVKKKREKEDGKCIFVQGFYKLCPAINFVEC